MSVIRHSPTKLGSTSPTVSHGIGNTIGYGVDAYMVGFTGAHPGDVIFLDDLASPLSQSLPWRLR